MEKQKICDIDNIGLNELFEVSMLYPKVVYEDNVKGVEFRIVAKIYESPTFIYEQSDSIDSMGQFVWKKISLTSFLMPEGQVDFVRMRDILSILAYENKIFQTMEECKILD